MVIFDFMLTFQPQHMSSGQPFWKIIECE